MGVAARVQSSGLSAQQREQLFRAMVQQINTLTKQVDALTRYGYELRARHAAEDAAQTERRALPWWKQWRS